VVGGACCGRCLEEEEEEEEEENGAMGAQLHIRVGVVMLCGCSVFRVL
jgi:hypothetical protein